MLLLCSPSDVLETENPEQPQRQRRLPYPPIRIGVSNIGAHVLHAYIIDTQHTASQRGDEGTGDGAEEKSSMLSINDGGAGLLLCGLMIHLHSIHRRCIVRLPPLKD